MEAGREGSAHRVIRGGSWTDDARNVRAASRNHNEPADRNDNLGFRCARAHERVGASAPEQARLQASRASARFRRNAGTAGVLVGALDGASNARRPAGVVGLW